MRLSKTDRSRCHSLRIEASVAIAWGRLVLARRWTLLLSNYRDG
jgi:hypothetical protein